MLEDQCHREVPNIQLFYRPVRQMVYAIIFNLHHHTFLAAKQREKDNTEKSENSKWNRPFLPFGLVLKQLFFELQMVLPVPVHLLTPTSRQRSQRAATCRLLPHQLKARLWPIHRFLKSKFGNGFGQHQTHTGILRLYQPFRSDGPFPQFTACGLELILVSAWNADRLR